MKGIKLSSNAQMIASVEICLFTCKQTYFHWSIFSGRLIVLSILWSKKTAGARKLEFRVFQNTLL